MATTFGSVEGNIWKWALCTENHGRLFEYKYMEELKYKYIKPWPLPLLSSRAWRYRNPTWCVDGRSGAHIPRRRSQATSKPWRSSPLVRWILAHEYWLATRARMRLKVVMSRLSIKKLQSILDVHMIQTDKRKMSQNAPIECRQGRHSRWRADQAPTRTSGESNLGEVDLLAARSSHDGFGKRADVLKTVQSKKLRLSITVASCGCVLKPNTNTRQNTKPTLKR